MTTLRLYQSSPAPCPYLPGRVAYHHISAPTTALSPQLYSGLIDAGFRRTGNRIHRPNCAMCEQCVSVRIPVAEFVANKSQRRVLAKNEGTETTIVHNPAPEHYFELYRQYISNRHPETESMQNVEDTFEHFLFSSWSDTFAIEFRRPTNELVCVAICDPVMLGWSAVYTFYNTKYSDRSPGTYAILKQIELLRGQELHYLYLGYWVSDCEKMNYKTKFQPCEGYQGQQWVRLGK